LGGEIFEDGAFVYNNPETVEAVQFMVNLYNEGCAALVAEQFGDQKQLHCRKGVVLCRLNLRSAVHTVGR